MRKAQLFLSVFCCLYLICAGPAGFAAGVSVITVNLEHDFAAPRWLFDPKAKIRGGPPVTTLVELKKSLNEEKSASCLSAAQKAYKQGKSLGPWIAWNHLACAQIKDKKGRVSVSGLKSAVAKVDANPSWLVYGPAAGALRTSYVGALMALAEQQARSDRRAAWQTLDKLQQVASWLSVDDRADMYRWAGELAFIEQNLGGAQSFLQRSLRERENSELRARVESIRSTLLGKKKEEDKAQVEEKLAGDLGISEEEKKIFERMNRAFESLDYVSAVEDAMNLLQQFPGSTNASEAADKVQNVYLSLATKTDERFRHVRERVVKEMSKGDAGRLSRWATSAYARGLYIDALNLAERAHEKYAGHPDSTRILLLAGKAAVAAGEYKSAQSHFESLVKQHGGTEEAAEATFRLGLIAYRLKQFPQAAAFFERLLAMSHGDDFEYRALYWQWRARQKIDAEKSSAYALPLITKYPLSYYGLRAQAETNGNQLQLSDKPLKVKVELRLLESERLAWERLTMLLKAGWFKEAENEIQALPQPQSPEEHLVRAKVWAAAFRYDNAIINMNKAFDTNPELLQLSVLRIVFPHEYSTWTAKEAKAVGLSEDLLRALIRQESSFRAEAQSSANALGVMQLLPSTAAEIARDLRMRNVEFPQALLKPDVNIRLGANYLYRMVKAFSGHVPLGLAAYNAGIGRMRRWLSSRPEIGALEGSPSSSPEAEVWLDELPWEETSFYVKAILRNWMIYRLLDGSKLSLSDPIWLDAKAGSR